MRVNVFGSGLPSWDTIRGLQTVADALPCIIWIADGSGNIEWSNGEFLAYTGMTQPAAMRLGWMPSIHMEDRLSLTRQWARCLSSGCELDSMARLRGDNGSYRWFSIRARPYRLADGTISNWFGTLTDVHEKQSVAEAKTHVVDALMKGYLSKELPVCSGLRFDTLYRAADAMEKLGGDWYDVFPLRDGRIAFSIGDVCGHGIDAAVKMGEAKQAIFVAASLGDPSPASVFSHANDVIFLNNCQVSITTAVYGIIDSRRRTVNYASAGHHPPILVRKDASAKILPNHGFPLGVEERMPERIQEHSFAYELGSILVLYTDGLIEFERNLALGETRLLDAASQAVKERTGEPARFIADHVLRHVTPLDDIAILTVSFE